MKEERRADFIVFVLSVADDIETELDGVEGVVGQSESRWDLVVEKIRVREVSREPSERHQLRGFEGERGTHIAAHWILVPFVEISYV